MIYILHCPYKVVSLIKVSNSVHNKNGDGNKFRYRRTTDRHISPTLFSQVLPQSLSQVCDEIKSITEMETPFVNFDGTSILRRHFLFLSNILVGY